MKNKNKTIKINNLKKRRGTQRKGGAKSIKKEKNVNNVFLPDCNICMDELATCRFEPCYHLIGRTCANRYSKEAQNNNKKYKICPNCRQPWKKIRCMTQKRALQELEDFILELIKPIPEGAVKQWYKSIMQVYVLNPNQHMEDDLRRSIGECLIDGMSVSKRSCNSPYLKVPLDKKTQIDMIECIRKEIVRWEKENQHYFDFHFSEGKPDNIKQILSIPKMSILAIEELKDPSKLIPCQEGNMKKIFINIKEIWNKIYNKSKNFVFQSEYQGLEDPRLYVVVGPMLIAGSLQMYRNNTYNDCSNKSTETPIEKYETEIVKGRWEFPVDNMCGGPLDFSSCCEENCGEKICQKDDAGSEICKMQGPDIIVSKQKDLEPGAYHKCSRADVSGLSCSLCQLQSDPDFCESITSTWYMVDDAHFVPTQNVTKPVFGKSEQQKCVAVNSRTSAKKLVGTVGIVIGISALLFAGYYFWNVSNENKDKKKEPLSEGEELLLPSKKKKRTLRRRESWPPPPPGYGGKHTFKKTKKNVRKKLHKYKKSINRK